MPKYKDLQRGDPAPWFRQRTLANDRFTLDVTGGRYLVLCFYGSAADAQSRARIDAAMQRQDIFDDRHASFFGVSIDPGDSSENRIRESYPGYRHFLDFDLAASRLYGSAPVQEDAAPENRPVDVVVRRMWVILDPTLRILSIVPFRPEATEIADVMAFVAGLPPPERYAGVPLQAPVIMLPNIFEPEFCTQLIGLYESHGGEESGFMREENGKTVLVKDAAHKRRRDHTLADNAVIQQIQRIFMRRITPEIAKIHQFHVTRMERYLVACYDAADSAHFRPHRDNTTKGTAHRRFAVSINLNSEFEGGEIAFPEYGPQTFKPAPGAAVVFSCSLLHAVTPVTRGKRYAFLPFLYDDAAAALRQQNARFLDTDSMTRQHRPDEAPDR